MNWMRFSNESSCVHAFELCVRLYLAKPEVFGGIKERVNAFNRHSRFQFERKRLRTLYVRVEAQERSAGLGKLLRLRFRNADAGLLGEDMDDVFPCTRVKASSLDGNLAIQRLPASAL